MTLAERYGRSLAAVVPMESPINIERGEGAYLVDRDGRRYLDLVMGIAVNAVGHAHPAVVRAVAEQAGRHLHVYSGTGYQEAVVAYAEALLADIGPNYRVFFGNSGAEAVEAAIKLARAATGRQAVVAFRGGFHGRTMGALSLTASAARYRSTYEPLVPGVYHVDFPAPTRLGLPPEAAFQHTVQQFEQLLACEVEPDHIAAVVVEAIQGEGGYVIPPSMFLPWLRQVTARHGILLAVDEVQAGMGRTGRMWAYQHDRIEPDLIIMGKALGGGLPLSAMAGRDDLMDRWPAGLHGSTFGGNPVAAAAGLATLQIIRREGLVEHAATLGRRALEALEPLRARSDVSDVRGRGLMVAVEFQGVDAPTHVERLVEASLRAGMYIHPAGIHHQVIRLMPPLNIEEAVWREALGTLRRLVEETAGR